MDSQTKIALGFVRCMPKPLPKVCHVDLLPESTSRCSAWVAMAARAAFHARKSKYKPPRILSVTIAQEYVRMRTDIPNAAARPHMKRAANDAQGKNQCLLPALRHGGRHDGHVAGARTGDAQGVSRESNGQRG